VPTTVLGFFDNQTKADEAIEELRQKFQHNNISIMLRGQNVISPANTYPSANLNIVQQFSNQTTKLGETTGGVMGRMAGMTMGAMMAFPMMMANTMMNAVSSMTSMGMNMTLPAGSMTTADNTQSVTGTSDNRVTLTIQSNDDISYAQHILKSHGAKEVSTYSS